MRNQRLVELSVGLFVLLALGALLVLAFRVSGLTRLSHQGSYMVYADFSNIGGLKVRAPVTIAGVRIGEVKAISLLPGSFNAKVSLAIDKTQNHIPYYETSARILTQGLLGSNYISIEPGFETANDDGDTKSDKGARFLKQGDRIEKTQQALVLENLIGQFLFNMNK